MFGSLPEAVGLTCR